MQNEMQFINLNLIFRNGVSYFLDAGNTWQAESHTCLQHRFYYITSGKCTIWIDGKKYTGIPGRWFIIPAGVPCAYASDSSKPFSKYWIHFDLIHNNPELISSMELSDYVDTPADSDVQKIFQAIDKCAQSDMLSDHLQVTSLLFSLFCQYIRLSGDMTISSFYEKDAQSKRIIGYIQRHLQEDLSNSILAAYLHMDVRSFIRYFKRITGMTPAKYVARLRMSIAQEMLLKTDMNISDIMYQVGISDLPLFSKMFKRVYSLSPKAYRETYRQQN